MRILVINPGGTSTKIGVFENDREILKENLTHTAGDLAPFPSVFDQFDYRRARILETLEKAGCELSSFQAVVGRGGLLKEITGGVYPVNQAMLDDLKNAVRGEHPSNLGAALAKGLADEAGLPSFVVDPVSVDEFDEVSRISGMSDIERPSWMHALNHKAVGRLVAKNLGGRYEDFRFIIAHLGSGISIAAHKYGRMIDGSGGRSNGPFSPERCGDLPAYPLIQLCYSGKYSHKEMVDKVSAKSGFYDYLGTKDLKEAEKRAEAGEAQAGLILEAFIYQTAKEISAYGAAFAGRVDRVILTGGIAYSQYVTEKIRDRVAYLAPVEVVAGEMEMEALALGALRVLSGGEEAKTYGGQPGAALT